MTMWHGAGHPTHPALPLLVSSCFFPLHSLSFSPPLAAGVRLKISCQRQVGRSFIMNFLSDLHAPLSLVCRAAGGKLSIAGRSTGA